MPERGRASFVVVMVLQATCVDDRTPSADSLLLGKQLYVRADLFLRIPWVVSAQGASRDDDAERLREQRGETRQLLLGEDRAGERAAAVDPVQLRAAEVERGEPGLRQRERADPAAGQGHPLD